MREPVISFVRTQSQDSRNPYLRMAQKLTLVATVKLRRALLSATSMQALEIVRALHLHNLTVPLAGQRKLAVTPVLLDEDIHRRLPDSLRALAGFHQVSVVSKDVEPTAGSAQRHHNSVPVVEEAHSTRRFTPRTPDEREDNNIVFLALVTVDRVHVVLPQEVEVIEDNVPPELLADHAPLTAVEREHRDLGRGSPVLDEVSHEADNHLCLILVHPALLVSPAFW